MNSNAIAAKKKVDSAFMKKGVFIAIMSGVTYGLYTGFLTLGMARGIWGADWYGANTSGLSVFAITYVLAALGSGVNDTISGIWMLIKCGIMGELGDWVRCLKTKPGVVMIICALIGGPIASTCYVAALQMAGTIIVPFAALNAAIGAIIGRFVFKQKLSPVMVGGIILCLICATVIGGTSFDGFGGTTMVGILLALVCALGWGIEGAVAGFGTTLIEYNIGITIRQVTSGVANMIIVLPLLCMIDGNGLNAFGLLSTAFTDSSVIFFVISGLFAGLSYGFWYKGASMCGAALGMTCNGAYAFWASFFTWVVCGLFGGIEGYALSAIQWIFAAIMIIGIAMVGDINPLSVFKKKEA